jgi:RNA polymerase sigma-70 factor, ECF subfamily
MRLSVILCLNASFNFWKNWQGGGTRRMSSESSPKVKEDLLAAIPRLRALAIGLCGKTDQAEDLVQETLVRAWANLSSFTPGTNMGAWLYTILRNEFYTDLRKRRHEQPDPDGTLAATLVSQPSQESRVDFQDLRLALVKLAPPQREAILLVGASGLSYEEAAHLCNCAVGTMKSRVYRARMRLTDLLNINLGVPPRVLLDTEPEAAEETPLSLVSNR